MGKHGQTKSKKKKNKKKKIFGFKFFVIILIMIGIAGGWFAKRVYDLDGNWLAAIMGHSRKTIEKLDRITVLLLGESGGNTDTIMLVTYDPKIQEAGMLSIPRDTFVGNDKNDPKQAKAANKINSLYHESPEKVVAAVSKIVGIDIKYYVLIDTKVLVELVDIIGGIEYTVPIDMRYDDVTQDLHINLKQGKQKLNGDQVEQLVRFRHNNMGAPYYGSTYPYDWGIEDYGRMRTQRAVAIVVARQTIKLKNVFEIGQIIDTLEKNVDTNVNVKAVKDYIPYGIKIDLETIKSYQLPGADSNSNPAGIWFFYHDKEETKRIVDEMFNLNPPVDGATDADIVS